MESKSAHRHECCEPNKKDFLNTNKSELISELVFREGEKCPKKIGTNLINPMVFCGCWGLYVPSKGATLNIETPLCGALYCYVRQDIEAIEAPRAFVVPGATVCGFWLCCIPSHGYNLGSPRAVSHTAKG